MSEPTTAVVTKEEKPMEYIPFGAADKIKLTIAIVKNLICVKTKSGKVCSDNDAIKFMMMCNARKLNPFEGDAFLIGYDGRDGTATFSLITAHQAFLKRAEVNPEYDGMKSGIIIERDGAVQDIEGDFYMPGDKVLGGWATVYFKTRKVPTHKRVRMARFKKPFGIWLDDDAGMICKCAEADAMRSSFPTMLGGLYTHGEVQVDEPPKTATPIFSPKAEEPIKDAEVVPETPKPTDIEYLKQLCAKDQVNEASLVWFMVDVGLASEKCKTLEDVQVKDPNSIGIAIQQWDEFSAKAKEVEHA